MTTAQIIGLWLIIGGAIGIVFLAGLATGFMLWRRE